MPPRKRDIPASQVPDVPPPTRPGAKGRPTPTRKEAEAARRKPLVQDRRTAAKEQRARARELRERERQALLSNDERNYPYRDRGPVRRWVRDYVDSQRTWREYLLPISIGLFILVFASAVVNSYVYVAFNLLLYVFMIFVLVSSWLYTRKIRRLAVEKFGEAKVPERIGMYGVLRAFQSRRARLPKPEVERGGTPR